MNWTPLITGSAQLISTACLRQMLASNPNKSGVFSILEETHEYKRQTKPDGLRR